MGKDGGIKMKLNGVIYYYAPKESDLKDGNILRKHLIRPTEGRVFLQIDEKHQWTIPFRSTTQLIGIFNKVRTNEDADLDFTVEKQGAFNGREMDDRRCLRISVADVNPNTDPMRHAGYLGKKGLAKQEVSQFCEKSTGVFLLLDSDEDYRYRKIYFTNMIDAGIQLDKLFSREVAKRIPVEETLHIPYDVKN